MFSFYTASQLHRSPMQVHGQFTVNFNPFPVDAARPSVNSTKAGLGRGDLRLMLLLQSHWVLLLGGFCTTQLQQGQGAVTNRPFVAQGWNRRRLQETLQSLTGGSRSLHKCSVSVLPSISHVPRRNNAREGKHHDPGSGNGKQMRNTDCLIWGKMSKQWLARSRKSCYLGSSVSRF